MIAAGWSLPPIVMQASYLIVGLVVVVLVLVVGVVSLDQRSTRDKTRGLVTGITGRMGSGKSYCAVRMALAKLQRGVDVYSNFHIDTAGLNVSGTWHPFTGWDQLSEIRDAVVIVDEAHLYAPSHQHINFPMLARWAIAHGRKHGLDLFWIAQHEDRVNRTLRDNTHVMAHCESYFGGKLFKVTHYLPEDFRKPKKHTSKKWYRLDVAIADRYDTLATIEVDEYSLKGDTSASKLRAAQRKHLDHESSGAHRNGATAAPARPVPAVPSLPPS